MRLIAVPDGIPGMTAAEVRAELDRLRAVRKLRGWTPEERDGVGWLRLYLPAKEAREREAVEKARTRGKAKRVLDRMAHEKAKREARLARDLADRTHELVSSAYRDLVAAARWG